MTTCKLTPELAALARSANANDWLDAVVEFKLPSVSEDREKSRSEKIAMQKEAFRQSVAPLEDVVEKIGGEITGRAWINGSVRLRIPVSRLDELSEIETVAKVDVSHQLKLDHS